MPLTDNDSLYLAFISKDVRFDGRFFIGISSTGIYCRPVCRARIPKKENCTFFSNAAEAELSGYRPCMLCRPELSPVSFESDTSAALAHRAARMLEQNCGSGQSLSDMAREIGCSDRHLRRIFTDEYHVSPIQYLQTHRLLLAKGLLTDTRLSVLDVAMASGFGSLRRFNDLFKKHYRLSPTALRKKLQDGGGHTGDITLELTYRAPYCWDEMLQFLGARAIKGIEVVKDGQYMRTVYMQTKKNTHYGWIKVGHKPKKNALSVTLSESLLPVLPKTLVQIRHLFDTYCEPQAVYNAIRTMNDIRPGLCIPSRRVPGCFDAFEMTVRAILGQQITVKAAGTLASRMTDVLGLPVQTDTPGLNRAFPTPEKILELGNDITNQLGILGVISKRSETIRELAHAFVSGEIKFDMYANPQTEIEKLMNIKGIGSWTAKYIAMRTMGWPDAFLETDAGIKKALPGYTAKELKELSKDWRPWRSYATINLWNSL